MPLLANRDTWAQGLEHAKKFKKPCYWQYQEMDDLDKVTQNLASERQGKNKLPCLSRELQVTIIKVSIRKILVV